MEQSPEQSQSSSYIIPPGLLFKRLEFEAHYHIAKGKPIIIVGDTGVGKTLFLHLFEKLYREEHGPNASIQKVNCAHFDDQLVRSELFGHKKGSFTGAMADKDGMLKKADKGVLFMEEIGELPKDAQAKLLTFIEDGSFFRVGSTVPEKASVQIVGTTNSPKNLRLDFWQRFMPFYVPPLYERREDVLYYLYDKFPELLKTLKQQEVLWLLAYHWPGNVRELERIARLLDRNNKIVEKGLLRKKLLMKALKQYLLIKEGKETVESLLDQQKAWFSKVQEDSFEKGFSQFLLGEEHEEFFLAVRSNQGLSEELIRSKVDVSLLDRLLGKYRLSLGPSSYLAFPELYENNGGDKFFTHIYDRRLDVKQFVRVGIFEGAKAGLDLFCTLFFQNSNAGKNLLDVREGTSVQVSFLSTNLPKTIRDAYLKLAKSIFGYMSGIDIGREKRIPEDDFERRNFLTALGDLYPANKYLASLLRREAVFSTQEASPDIWSMRHDDLLKYYYKGMVERAGGVQEHAARKMGINYRTFRSRCQKLGLKFSIK